MKYEDLVTNPVTWDTQTMDDDRNKGSDILYIFRWVFVTNDTLEPVSVEHGHFW